MRDFDEIFDRGKRREGDFNKKGILKEVILGTEKDHECMKQFAIIVVKNVKFHLSR